MEEDPAEINDHAGFRLNALVSLLPNASWGRLAREFLTVKSDPSTLQTFVNTILGQGWREEGEELDDTELSTRAEPFGLVADEKTGCTGIPEQVRVHCRRRRAAEGSPRGHLRRLG